MSSDALATAGAAGDDPGGRRLRAVQIRLEVRIEATLSLSP